MDDCTATPAKVLSVSSRPGSRLLDKAAIGGFVVMTKPAAKSQATLDLALAMLERATQLLAGAPAKSAERPAPPQVKCPTPPQRVEALLDDIGVTPEDLRTSRNSSTAMGAKVIAARRAMVAMFAAEGLGAVQIARETGLSTTTVREYLPR